MSRRLFEDGTNSVLRTDAQIDVEGHRLNIDEALSGCIGRAFSLHGPFRISLEDLVSLADEALREANRRNAGENSDPDYELAAQEFVATVALAAADQASIANGQGGLTKNARLAWAAYRVGVLAAQRDFAHRGLLGEAVVKQVNQEQQIENAKKSAEQRRRDRAPVYDKAYAEFEARKNKRQTANAWSQSNAERFGVKANHLARELRERVFNSGGDQK